MVHTGITDGVLIVGGSVLAALLVIELFRRWLRPVDLEKASGLVGSILAIVGTFYGILLGLVVVDCLTRFERSIDTVRAESNCLADMFLIAERLPEPYRGRVQGLCRRYALMVVEQEWPLMTQGSLSIEARKTAVTLLRSLHDFEPATEAEKAVYPLFLDLLRQLWDNRRERAHAAEFGIPAIEWAALVLGSVATIVLLGLYAAEHLGIQRFVVSLAAAVIALNLYLVMLFGYPFAGELSVSSRPFEIDIDIFDGLYDQQPAHAAERSAVSD